MFVSVILSTYNAPAWLEKALWGYRAQSHTAFEVIIADDGSTEETAALIERVRRETGLRLRHVWHEDRGFRKCVILNQAIQAAEGDYLVFSDGDCIPRADFVESHVRLAGPRAFLSGGYYKLPLDLSRRIDAQAVASGRATSWRWLIHNGLPRRVKSLRLACPAPLATLLDHLTTTRATWNGHNASTWRQHLLEVNGFDERMGYGGEDRELGERLTNAGIRGRQTRHRAVCLHLEHGRGYVDARTLAANRDLRKQTRGRRSTWTPHGIVKAEHPHSQPWIGFTTTV